MDDIKEAASKRSKFDGFVTAQKITGYGGTSFCTLCIAVQDERVLQVCKDCVYNIVERSYGCLKHKSYDDIEEAKTPAQLRGAFRRRAKYMRNLLKKHNIK